MARCEICDKQPSHGKQLSITILGGAIDNGKM